MKKEEIGVSEASKTKRKTTRKTSLETKLEIEKKDENVSLTEKKEKRTKNSLKSILNDENSVKKSLEFSLVEVIIIILITTALVSVCSGFIVFRNYDKLKPLTKTNDDRSSNEIIDSYNQIVNKYIEKVDKEKLIDAAIAGMYSLLEDEYSIYIDKEVNESLQEQLVGTYSGIGIEITMNEKNQILVNRVFEDSPAEKAGLKPGDILTELDGVDLSDKNSAYVSETIKGSDKQTFKLSYKRDSKEYNIDITRSLVSIDSVTSREYGNVGYLKIDTFSAPTYNQVVNALDKYGSNIKSIVVDLRDNTGGYLDIANSVSELFLEKGKIIYKLKDRDNKITEHKSKTGVHRKFDKIVVIINANSASASEILTLALKESANAKVVGINSYGKGTVQETQQLSSGAMVKYTTSYWLSPNGNSINKIGIKPDVKIENVDKQLEEAIKLAE